MPLEVMDKMLISRCKETDNVIAYIELLPLQHTMLHYSSLLIEFNTEECNTLARLTLTPTDSTLDPYLPSRAHLARKLLWALVRWQEKDTFSQSEPWSESKSAVSHAGVTAFIALVLCALKSKEYRTLHSLIFHSMRFLELLMSGSIVAMQKVVRDILVGNLPVVCIWGPCQV